MLRFAEADLPPNERGSLSATTNGKANSIKLFFNQLGVDSFIGLHHNLTIILPLIIGPIYRKAHIYFKPRPCI